VSEIIDIFDANLQPIGSKERIDAHRDGDWHRTFHLWLTTERNGGSLLFQLRSPSAKNFPDLLDVTAAGHLMSGETPEMGIREATEELGIEVPQSSLNPLGYRVEVADQVNGQRNREYQAVFIAKENRELLDYRPDPREVYGILELPISEGYALFSGQAETINTNSLIFDEQLSIWSIKNQVVRIDRFLPRVQQYYLTMLIMSERLIEGRMPIAIS
jgi:isopentenyldiphosphate isomerase